MKYMLFICLNIFLILPLAAKDKATKKSAVCLNEITTNLSPAELFPSVKKCIKEKKYDASVQNYMITMAFGVYDTKRVADPAAHKGLNSLHDDLMKNISKKEKEKFLADLKKLGDDKGMLKDICDKIKKIGYPVYRPEYMLNFAVNIKAKSTSDEFTKNFSATSEWENVLKTFMTCN